MGGSLEASTVDIATEFTNLITYQRSYQANSRVITTADQMTTGPDQLDPVIDAHERSRNGFRCWMTCPWTSRRPWPAPRCA